LKVHPTYHNAGHMIRWFQLVAFAMLLTWSPPGRAALPAGISDAIAWYDKLGFPDTKNLPYVRVATGSWVRSENQPPENTFVEGFLVRDDSDAFSVFLCSATDFKGPFDMSRRYAPLTTVRFVRKDDGPAHERVGYEVLDFNKASSDALDRQRGQNLRGSENRALVFAVGRACLQKGLTESGAEFINMAASIPEEQSGKVDPRTLRKTLQEEIGAAVLLKAEKDLCNPSISWAESMKVYEGFPKRFPASSKVGYARESADLLKKMIAEASAHHPKPLEEMSLEEQIAEYIYQLRTLAAKDWVINSSYQIMVSGSAGKEANTPVHRLAEFGYEAVPQLIEALDDRRFTRSLEMVNLQLGAREILPSVMRVGDFAQKILEHTTGRAFGLPRAPDGKLLNVMGRQRAEAWWTEFQSEDKKKALIEATGSGGEEGGKAARKLVEEYPHSALAAIEEGVRATTEPDVLSAYVEAAGSIPGGAPVDFLKSKLGSGNGLYAQTRAAEALFARGKPEALPAMIEAWQNAQPRLPTNEADAFSEIGGLIEFLAKSGDAAAVDALGRDIRKAPVEVRLAVVDVFVPWEQRGTEFLKGRKVHALVKMPELPGGAAGDAIERLLATALDDPERRFGMRKDYDEASIDGPRVCDIAAFALSQRWPKKYQFHWRENLAECDAQVTRIRDQWRSENGLPSAPALSATVVPVAKAAEVTPLLEAFAMAPDTATRDDITAQIATRFGFGALSVVRSRFEKSKNEAYRPLAINLASRVREVVIEADAGDGAAKSGIAGLQGACLAGGRLYKLAYELESVMPSDVRAVTFVAERTGDGAGFKVTIGWLAGGLDRQTGWDREMCVQQGNKSLYYNAGYTSDGDVAKGEIYRGMGDAFEGALQAEIDAPIIVRIRSQRERGPVESF
jgi:hypothetical protein